MTHKFGICLPHSVKEALRINEEMGTDYWQWAINKEMAKLKVAWRVYEGHTPEQVRGGKVSELIRFQEIRCHMIFDIKMDITHKAHFIAGGHTMEAPASVLYSCVVSCDSIHLAFLIAALNDINILSCYLENAYVNAKCHEKIWLEAGIKCGKDAGKVLVIVRALYGLKSAGALWHLELAQLLSDLGYKSKKVDPDVWIQKTVCPDGFEYYEMLFVYVNDILSMSHCTRGTRETIAKITKYYKAKGGSIKEPDINLRADISKMQLPDGHVVWTTSTRTYVKNAIKVVEQLFAEDGEGYTLKSKAKYPLPTGY